MLLISVMYIVCVYVYYVYLFVYAGCWFNKINYITLHDMSNVKIQKFCLARIHFETQFLPVRNDSCKCIIALPRRKGRVG
jgi:hypothetical protein